MGYPVLLILLEWCTINIQAAKISCKVISLQLKGYISTELQIHTAQTQFVAQPHPGSWSHTMCKIVCAYIFSLLILKELYACGNMDLKYEGREKMVVKSAVPPCTSNYQTFLFIFLGNMQWLCQRNMLISFRVEIRQLSMCDCFLFGVADSCPYFLLRIDNWFLHIPYQDMDIFLLDLFCQITWHGKNWQRSGVKEYIHLW
jgi:hypothetical protein